MWKTLLRTVSLTAETISSRPPCAPVVAEKRFRSTTILRSRSSSLAFCGEFSTRFAPEVPPTRDLGRNLLSWVLGCLMVYLALFGLGHVLIGPFWEGVGLLAVSAACAGALYSNISRSLGVLSS